QARASPRWILCSADKRMHQARSTKRVSERLAEFEEDDLPTQTYYGDGAPIEPEVLENLRRVYRGALHEFAWRTNDVLLVDNILTVHGRNPFRGFRRILVAMAQTFQPNDWAVGTGVSA